MQAMYRGGHLQSAFGVCVVACVYLHNPQDLYYTNILFNLLQKTLNILLKWWYLYA